MTRSICTATCALLLVAAAAEAQPPPPPVPWGNKLFLPDIAKNPTQPPPPVISHDFGTVPHGTLCAHKFTVTNIYDVPMQVVDIRRSCGCLEAYPPQRVLQPNEQAEFLVTMDTAKFSGPNAQTVHITFGPQYVSTAVLRFQANSRSDVQLNPGRVNFGTVAQGAQAAPQAVTVEYNGRQRDWAVTGVVPPAGPIEVEVKPAAPPGAWLGRKYQVTVSLKPTAPAGPVAEVLTLKTNDPAAPVIQVNVVGLVQAPLTLTAERVNFGKVKVGEEAHFQVLVRSANNQLFAVQPVPEDADGVSADALQAAGPVRVVTVRFKPTRPGPVRKELKLETSLNGGATATILVEGEGEGEPPGM
jgi:hypothetical protein